MKNAFSLVALLSVLLSARGIAAADWTPYVGTRGSYPFVTYCSQQVSLTGLHVRAGNYIDAIQGACGYVNVTPWFGGNGGAPVDLLCGAGSMKGVNSEWGDYVDALQAACYHASSRTWLYSGWAGTQGDNYSSLRCASGYYAKGFRGEAGAFLDRLSLFCAR